MQVGRVMSDEQADALRERMFAVMEGRSDVTAGSRAQHERAAGKRCRSRSSTSGRPTTCFTRICSTDDMTQMVAEVIGTDTLRVWHDQVQYKPPRVGGPTDWHQDHPYWPIIQPADLVSAWVALDDADEENGCMWMVPGSHKWGPHKGGTIGTNRDDFTPTPDLACCRPALTSTPVPMPVKKGHVGLHHCLTWHGRPPNRSERGRPAIAVHYMPGYTRYEKDPGRTHLVEHNVEVAPGEILQGKHFPTV